ncbi:MAG: cupin domain-containing protein [Cyclobacteriaceae bacterium]|nr:cupin domain-containing protein [Cyclobacteriaceae bacterium]
MQTAEYWIGHLQLKPHPEGGFYRETYRSAESIPATGLPSRFEGSRSFSTAIYFLLRSGDRSLFHRIKSDELWHFHAGTSLSIFVLHEQGLTIHRLGSDPEKEEALQIVIPAGSWFGAQVNEPNSYTLSGCTIAPGFDFHDFELASRKKLIEEFPAHRSVIEMLTDEDP